MFTIGKKIIRDIEKDARAQLRNAEIQRKIAEKKEKEARETLGDIREHGRPRIKTATVAVAVLMKKSTRKFPC